MRLVSDQRQERFLADHSEAWSLPWFAPGSDERKRMTFLCIGDTALYGEESGSGEPVLFLHGGFHSMEYLRPLADVLAANHRVLAYERPGHGRSPDVAGEYDYAQSALETLAYLDAKGISSAHVIGYSDGAVIGLLLASQYPQRVRSLVAISGNLNPQAFTDRAGDAGALVLGPLPTGHGAAEPPEGASDDAERQHYQRLSPDGPRHADAVLEKLLRLWTSQPKIEPAELSNIDAPTLVMSADRDTIRLDHTIAIASAIPGAQLCIVPGATHDLVAERPSLVGLIVAEFLDSSAPR